MSGIHESSIWSRLQHHKENEIDLLHLRNLLKDEERSENLVVEHDGIVLDFSRERVTLETMDMLFELADAAMLDQKRTALARGERINSTEDRAVLHMALRAPRDTSFCVDGQNVVPEVWQVLDQIREFTTQVRHGASKGVTNKRFKNIISVGIGGSYLGGEFVYEALRSDPHLAHLSEGLTLRFLSNVDPVDCDRAVEGLNPEETLVIVISKTFTTLETMTNLDTMLRWLQGGLPSSQSLSSIRSKHIVAVTSNKEKAMALDIPESSIFTMWDWVGGRYSVSSAVGMLPLSLFFSFEVMEEFLRGCHQIDQHFFEAPPRENLPVLMGLLGVWNASFLELGTKAILPYAQALSKFPDHVQQLDMESNGKSVSSSGLFLPHPTGEIVFGGCGTNSQHSFFQLLHQGRVAQCEFIGFATSYSSLNGTTESSSSSQMTNHDELMSNFFAQPDALAIGRTREELEEMEESPELIPHKQFSGNRPSLSLLFPSLTPYSCGQLLALYEHRVAVQGMVWGINSFDQWGVELGKKLAKKVRVALLDEGSEEYESMCSSTKLLMGRYKEMQSTRK